MGAHDPKQSSYTLITWRGIDFGRPPVLTDCDSKIWSPIPTGLGHHTFRSRQLLGDKTLTNSVQQLAK